MLNPTASCGRTSDGVRDNSVIGLLKDKKDVNADTEANNDRVREACPTVWISPSEYKVLDKEEKGKGNHERERW